MDLPVESWARHSTVVKQIIDCNFPPEEKDVILRAMDHAFGNGEPLTKAEWRMAKRLAGEGVALDDVRGWIWEAAFRVVELTRPLPAETRALLCRCINFISDPCSAGDDVDRHVVGVVSAAGISGLTNDTDDQFERALVGLMSLDHASEDEESHEQFMARLRQEGIL